MMTPSLLSVWGQHRKRRYWRGATGRPGSWTGAKSRDGSSGNLGDPALARGQRGWKGDCQHENPDPGPSPGLYGDGSAPGRTRTPAGTRGAGWRINKPKDMRGQEVVAPSIVLTKTGNRGHRDPAEGRGASHVRTTGGKHAETLSSESVSTRQEWIAKQARPSSFEVFSTCGSRMASSSRPPERTCHVRNRMREYAHVRI